MKVNIFSRDEFFDFAYHRTQELMDLLIRPEAIIVKNLIPKDKVWELRNATFQWGIETESSWHPLHDNCPDYHRLHDNYPNAHVKQKFHGFYRHGWYEENKSVFETFKEIFRLKNYLGNYDKESFFNNIPSDGVIARFNIHHYPKGGGYQAEHIDPAGPFAKIQTLIMGSQIGEDYHKGGLFARVDGESDKFYLDPHANIGDMVVISPAIRHGVDEIDPEVEYSPNTNDGRWLLLPIFLYSDYEHPDNVKPKQIS
jgi:hypothetical protein